MGLNPCCGGRCSSTCYRYDYLAKSVIVLILVVVEDVLVLVNGGEKEARMVVLILVVVEDVLVHALTARARNYTYRS